MTWIVVAARRVSLAFMFASLPLAASVDAPGADGSGIGQPNAERRAFEAAGMTNWLKTRFSETELEGLPPGHLSVEAYSCSCYDQPTRHFPYRMVLLKTPKGDLIARPEGQDGVIRFIALAVRYADLYCDVESKENCYGTFAHPCDFSDFRYGPHLSAFFPTCKSDDAE
jgi:hypothetical protein